MGKIIEFTCFLNTGDFTVDLTHLKLIIKFLEAHIEKEKHDNTREMNKSIRKALPYLFKYVYNHTQDVNLKNKIDQASNRKNNVSYVFGETKQNTNLKKGEKFTFTLINPKLFDEIAYEFYKLYQQNPQHFDIYNKEEDKINIADGLIHFNDYYEQRYINDSQIFTVNELLNKRNKFNPEAFFEKATKFFTGKENILPTPASKKQTFSEHFPNDTGSQPNKKHNTM